MERLGLQVSTLAGNGRADFKDGAGAEASFNSPKGIAVDYAGNVIVADNRNHCVRRINLRGEVSILAGTARTEGYRDGPGDKAAFFFPDGVAVAAEGTVCVADCGNSRVRSVNAQGEVSTFVAIENGSSNDLASIDKRPVGVALAPDGGLVISDWLLHRIQRVSSKGGATTSTWVGSGEEGKKDGPAAEASFTPRRVAMGPDGQVLVTNEDGRVCKIEGGFLGKGRVRTVAMGFKAPTGLIVDCRGNAIVADSGNHQICFCNFRGDVCVIAGDGRNSFKDGPSEQASFSSPHDLALNLEGSVVVTDSGNHRVRVLTLSSTMRLRSELLALASSLPPGCAMSRSTRSLFNWVAVFTVQEGPFHGGLFELSFEMPFDYPMGGPRVKFVTPIIHPNVDPDTGEVSVEWDETSTLVSALECARELLVYPRLNDPAVTIKNHEAKELFEKNQLAFDSGAHEGARQSWLSKLKPGDASNLVCDLLVPCKKMSQEAQHELFTAMAEPEIEAHANEVYPPLVTIHLSKDTIHLKRDTIHLGKDTIHLGKTTPNLHKIRDYEEKARQQKITVLRGDLNLKLTETLLSLSALRNPRAEVAEWLESELARLCVAEARGKETIAFIDPPSERVRQLLNQTLPRTSKQCFEMLVAEAEEEAKRLEGKMEACTAKFNFLYSRFKRVREIKPVFGTPTQPPDYSVRVLLAQAKLLEFRIRHEFRTLVDTFNQSIKDTDQQSEEKATEAQAQSCVLTESIKGSTLRLSNGLRAVVKFGPMKSLSRLQQKGSPTKVLDYARVTVIFADPLLLALFFNELNTKFNIVRVHNKFVEKSKEEPPNVHINFAFQDHVCEAQLMLEDFVLIKEFSHKPYEIVRIAPKHKEGEDPTEFERKQREAIEHIISEGVHYPHPGADCYPMCSHPVLNTKLSCFVSDACTPCDRKSATEANMHRDISENLSSAIELPDALMMGSTVTQMGPVLPKIAARDLMMGVPIGEGAFSVVWEAKWQSPMGTQRVAVKIPKLVSRANTELFRELAVIASLPHQNILTLHGVCELPNGPAIVSEWMSGDLASLLRTHKRQSPVLPAQMLLRVLHDVSAGLAHLHKYYVIHRDVKPANVLLRDEQVKLCDFGSSQDLQHSICQMSTVGTLDYMAPELINREPAGRSLDVWSFGVLLFECVTGHVCARRSSVADLEDELTRAGCLIELVKLFAACHDDDPRRRPSMTEIHTRLRGLVLQGALDSHRLKEEIQRAEEQDRDTYDAIWCHHYANQAGTQSLQEYAKLLQIQSSVARQPLQQKGSMEELEALASGPVCARLQKHLRAIVEGCGGTYLHGPRKPREQCVKDVQKFLGGDFSNLLDLEHAVGLFEEAEKMLQCVQKLQSADSSSVSLVCCKDRLNMPLRSGHRDLLLDVRDAQSGFVAELKLSFHKMAQIKSLAHDFYEFLRGRDV